MYFSFTFFQDAAAKIMCRLDLSEDQWTKNNNVFQIGSPDKHHWSTVNITNDLSAVSPF